MSGKMTLLSELHQARLDRLREICSQHNISKTGSVEVLRAKLISELVLDEWDFSPNGIDSILNNDLGRLLAVFGVKKSGSIRERRQRLYLHLNYDAKQLTPEKLDSLSRDQLHELCSKLGLPRSGTKQALLMRVAGVLTSQSGSWGVIKKSLRRPRGKPKLIEIPSPNSEQEEPSFELQELDVTTSESKDMDILPTADIESDLEPEVINAMKPSVEIEPVISQPKQFELTDSIIEMESRTAEIDALCRDFLLIGSIEDLDDVNAFVLSLTKHGFNIADSNSANYVKGRLQKLHEISEVEKDAIHSMPNSWREREALRKFESARDSLRNSLPEIISQSETEMVKARMLFEEKARQMGLDLRIPAISGRLHALFDLQISLDEDIAASNPKSARRTRVIRLLQHGAVHLAPSERRTLDRLERNIEGFEQLAEAILEKSGGEYSEAQQTLVIRFLEKKGYDVNNPELRPRVVAAAGVIGAEMGHISPSEIPKLAPGIKVSDKEVDSIITDLKRLAEQFKTETVEDVDHDSELAESVADASERVNKIRSKIDGVDDLLARLKLSNN